MSPVIRNYVDAGSDDTQVFNGRGLGYTSAGAERHLTTGGSASLHGHPAATGAVCRIPPFR